MLCVAAFDEGVVSPVGWKSGFGPGLGSAEAAAAGGAAGWKLLRWAHHAVDWTDPGANPAVRAGELAAAAGRGVVALLRDRDDVLVPFLGAELFGLMSDRVRIEGADEHGREALSVAMRRAALRDHSLSARVRQVREAAGEGLERFALVSVLAPTRRPDRLGALVDSVASQSYPRVELVVGLHGGGFEMRQVEAELARLECPSRAVAVPADRSLGEVLNAALAASSGELVAKFDDDDIYGADHLWDLVLATEYTDAALVGKGNWFVYLADADRTIRRSMGSGELYIDPAHQSVTGAASLVRRDALDAIGGWRHVTLGEDAALVKDIAWTGRRVYRTHGFGFVAMRHGQGHTWTVDDAYFLDKAADWRPGLDLGFAGVT